MPAAGTLTDPVVTVKNLLRGAWIPANTPLTGTPTFSTGRYDLKSSRPQVCVPSGSRSDTPAAGGGTGYDSIRPDGSGPNRRTAGFVQVEANAVRVDGGANPKAAVAEMVQEIDRIITANFDGTGDLMFLAYHGPLNDVDDSVSPAVFRAIGEVHYQYIIHP